MFFKVGSAVEGYRGSLCPKGIGTVLEEQLCLAASHNTFFYGCCEKAPVGLFGGMPSCQASLHRFALGFIP
jgi:hypothetical protein